MSPAGTCVVEGRVRVLYTCVMSLAMFYDGSNRFRKGAESMIRSLSVALLGLRLGIKDETAGRGEKISKPRRPGKIEEIMVLERQKYQPLVAQIASESSRL
jgi:hypothetical protein